MKIMKTHESVNQDDNKITLTRNVYIDSPLRSFLKAIMWRILASLVTFVITYIITSKIYIAGFVMFIDMLAKIFLYYVHERIWTKIKFGIIQISE